MRSWLKRRSSSRTPRRRVHVPEIVLYLAVVAVAIVSLSATRLLGL